VLRIRLHYVLVFKGCHLQGQMRNEKTMVK
jgi:hypothetical protein